MAKEIANNLAWDGEDPVGKGLPVRRKLRVGIIDADLLDHGTRHPNLALMKLSGWYNHVRRDGTDISDRIIYPSDEERESGARLVLEDELAACTTPEQLVGPNGKFEKLVVSKVFDFSKLHPLLEKAFSMTRRKGWLKEADEDISCYSEATPRIVYGGTGFKTGLKELPKNLPKEIEHWFPDYHLYDKMVEVETGPGKGKKRTWYKDYLDYSIGFTSRGCFRHCPFCVNRHYNNVTPHSDLIEFVDPARKFIYLWDDNFLGLIHNANKDCEAVRSGRVTWETILEDLRKVGKSFQFRQGLDIRDMTYELASKLSSCRYHGDYIFAFDHYKQKRYVAKGLLSWKRANPDNVPKLYVLTGFRCSDNGPSGEVDDILNTMRRIRILMHFGSLPYLMSHLDYKGSTFKGLYTQLARWCNQPNFFKKKSFREYVDANQRYHEAQKGVRHKKATCACKDALDAFEASDLVSSEGMTTQQIADEFFDLRWDDFRDCWKNGAYGEPGLLD